MVGIGFFGKSLTCFGKSLTFFGKSLTFFGKSLSRKKKRDLGKSEKSEKKLMLTFAKPTNKICSPLFYFFGKKRKKRKIKKS